jgi:ATP-independent RNA helicase DbpA
MPCFPALPVRPMDIVGGLTGKDGIPGDKIGKINVNSN